MDVEQQVAVELRMSLADARALYDELDALDATEDWNDLPRLRRLYLNLARVTVTGAVVARGNL